MLFNSVFVASTLVAGAIAAPNWAPWHHPGPSSTCLTGPKATAIVNSFASLLTAPQASTFNATATALLASDFTDTSDSINQLAGYPLGNYTFPTKEYFIIGQGSQAPIPTVNTLDIFFTCNKIAWRWVGLGIGSGVSEVKGINTFTVNTAGQIESSYSEFNSAAWLKDVGNPECKAICAAA